MVQNYIGINGIVTQDLNSITAELINDFKGIYGDNVNLESNTADGQWLNILAQQKIDALDFQVQLYNNIDVDSVVGLPQQVLYKLNGLTIKDYTYSWVYINVTVSQNVTLSGLDSDIANIDGSGYTVSDINGNNWILAESISLVQSETPYLLLFRAQELGQITALANTITTMSTIVAGVVNVNNPANNFITGQTGETAAEFRTRRNRSLQAPSQGFKESIEGQLLALNDVSDAKVYDNKDDVSINGVQVIVQGGTSEEIGNIIYNNLPPGINTQGANEAIITVNNRDKVLNYDKPNPIPIYVKGTIESLTGNINDVDLDYVKQALASKQFRIGELAESANITTELKNILGETGSPYGIEISLSFTGGVWSDLVQIASGSNYRYYRSIAYGNGLYITGCTRYISKSSDLTTWNTVSSNFDFDDIVYAYNMFIAVGSDGVFTSTNGTTWTNRKSALLKAIRFVNNKLVAVGPSSIITSEDGITWSNAIELPNIGSESIAYGANKYVIAGTSGIAYSSNGIDWTQLTIPGARNIFYDITYGNGLFIAVGIDGYIVTSSDGINWNVTQQGTDAWNRISFLNGVFIALNKNIIISEDGINWSIQPLNNANYSYKGVTTNDDLFVVVGDNNLTTSCTTYELPNTDWKEILTPSGLADFFVMTVDGMDNLTVVGDE